MKLNKFGTALTTILLLSGCGGIPTSSDVYFGEVISEDSSTQFVRVIARPPTADMEPEAIVRGFLEACADPSGDYAIARQYLTADSATTWNPAAGIEVYEANSIEVSGQQPSLVVAATKQGAISDLGRFQTADPGAQLSRTFKVSQDASNQWRITDLSDGILLSTGDVDRSFRSFPIYFLNSSLTSLVSDSVIVPVNSSGAATSLVRSLLDGPTPYLGPVATTAFPVGTALTYGSVPVVNGIAQVDLSQEILGADELTRRALSAQLVWTLSALPNVSGVRITVSGQPLALTDIGVTQTVSDWQEISPLLDSTFNVLNVIRADKIYSVVSDVSTEKLIAPANLIGAIANRDSSQIAAITNDLKTLLVTNVVTGEFEVAAQGEVLSRPTWDQDGNIYVADFGQGVLEVTKDGTTRAIPVDVSNLGTTDQVKQVVVAQDGVRVAVVLSDGIQDVIAVGALFRTDTETRIVGLHRIERNISQVRDIAWSSPNSLAAIAADGSGGEMLFDTSLLDGKTKLSSTPPGTQALAIDGSGIIYISVVDGSKQLLYRQTFGSWSELTTGVGGFFTR
ncbi:unannotated protein [freshwater metagenome]|uniref:Unannotated protein n=1 Tax=freshwater metagenome TaxID=449393 RepID=A0A6J7BMY2_9ZZZZ|nr:hypothetical protein [Actinomycetota bacterium]MSW24047.1 hypothetical protein [Actinomycetota bacterium]MSX29812.1 hypothetical protein [Actinomycetota bacterium]MSX42967.1 hypothetical protein [Actinomycetota bacterium]MSX96842.1 hypothetical protein [Actinomycetota bacterium]